MSVAVTRSSRKKGLYLECLIDMVAMGIFATALYVAAVMTISEPLEAARMQGASAGVIAATIGIVVGRLTFDTRGGDAA